MKKFLIIVCVLLLLCSCATVKEEKRTITVNGNGSVTLKANMVSFNISVNETAPSTGEAQNLVNKKIGEVIAILKNNGITEECIATASLNFSSEYYWDENTHTQKKNGERVSQSLHVKLYDQTKFASVVDELGAKISGITLNNVNFDVKDRSDSLTEARKLAFEDAYNKAQIYAQTSGNKLGKAISVVDGYSEVNSGHYRNYDSKMMAAESAVYSTEAPSGLLSVSGTCTVVFELE